MQYQDRTRSVRRQFILLFCIVLSGLVVVGCAPPSINVTFETLSAPDPPKSGEKVFFVLPPRTDVRHLVFSEWANLAANELRAHGLEIVDNRDNANLIGYIELEIDQGRTELRPFVIPQFGITGYTGSMTFGTFSGFGHLGQYTGQTTLIPQYGITGYSTAVTADRVYTRRGLIVLARPNPRDHSFRPIYASLVTSEGSCNILPVVAPALVKAMFTSFPQQASGRTNIYLDRQC